MPDWPGWLVFVLCIFCWMQGFLAAWAASHDHDPFWRGWNDVWSGRIFVRKWRRL
jgi:hypothetical protein